MVYEDYQNKFAIGCGLGYQFSWHAMIDIPRSHVLQGNFNDVRFTSLDGVDLPYHRLYYDILHAVFVVRIPANTGIIHLHTGNNSATLNHNPITTYNYYNYFVNTTENSQWLNVTGNWEFSASGAYPLVASPPSTVRNNPISLTNARLLLRTKSSTPETLTSSMIKMGIQIRDVWGGIDVWKSDISTNRRVYEGITSGWGISSYAAWSNNVYDFIMIKTGSTPNDVEIKTGIDPATFSKLYDALATDTLKSPTTSIALMAQNGTINQLFASIAVMSGDSYETELSSPLGSNPFTEKKYCFLLYDNIYIPAVRRSDKTEIFNIKEEKTFNGDSYVYTSTKKHMPKITWHCVGSQTDYDKLEAKRGKKLPLFVGNTHWKKCTISHLKQYPKKYFNPSKVVFEVEFTQHTARVV